MSFKTIGRPGGRQILKGNIYQVIVRSNENINASVRPFADSSGGDPIIYIPFGERNKLVQAWNAYVYFWIQVNDYNNAASESLFQTDYESFFGNAVDDGFTVSQADEGKTFEQTFVYDELILPSDIGQVNNTNYYADQPSQVFCSAKQEQMMYFSMAPGERIEQFIYTDPSTVGATLEINEF